MDDVFFVKDGFILLLLIFFAGTAIFCLIRKIMLWLGLSKNNRPGIISSFFMFFSVHDVHQATGEASKKFHRFNNYLNAFFWVSLLAFAFVMVFNTEDSNKMIKTKMDQYK